MTHSTDPVRRRTLIALGAAVVSPALRAQSAPGRPACVVTAEQTEGPYFLDTRLNRADLRKDPATGSLREGVPLRLTLRLQRVDGDQCAPLAGATVHVWHCDANGDYSGIDGSKSQFLRGYQVSDKNGVVRFRTIYPGWYPGRTVHIHFKVRAEGRDRKPYELTSQLYFDDAITDKVMAQPPYAARGQRDRINRSDGLYRRSGRELMLRLAEDGKGYAAEFDAGVAFG
ncbi:intradiol ring-cleavage dioxygenase [Noviherbaspirillum aridicola]|uniref:Protocatechuate dioxygenase n=1 Tax=Noviherbaspirillum aridicola TaxID=2849687 RepID=A0ABQ4Q9C7_9BURK|nr:intradiol ring-cleavage dioxygenase [Noviherbaspirillum aridicola]GIZ53651.1 protocatechuate dioxygenase [Noviherbaspirillum aridicola]